MTARTPAQLALAAAGCLSAFADTRRSKQYRSPAFLRVEANDRRLAQEALDRWIVASEDKTDCFDWHERATRFFAVGADSTECDTWADALREWSREHGEAQPPRRKPCLSNWSPDGARQTFVCHLGSGHPGRHRDAEELAWWADIDDGGCWTLPQPASRDVPPDPGNHWAAPQKTAESATVGQRIALDMWDGPMIDRGEGVPHFAGRIDAAVAEAVQDERLDRHESESRLTREHEAHIATLGAEVSRAERERDDAVSAFESARDELDALRAKIRALISGAK